MISKRKTFRTLLLAFLAGLVLGIAAGLWLTRDLPEVDSLQFSTPHLMTRIYARDGSVLKSYGQEKRTLVHFQEISPNFIRALIAVEDASFYSHHGISLRGAFRALIKDILHRRVSQGGSTLTQQLARQYFLTPKKTITRKLKEAVLAINIESHFTKDQILEMYANKVCFGQAYYGIETSSQHYFGKSSRELTIPEAAMLAGIIQRPSYYSPRNHPDRVLKRRNHVLFRMWKTGAITEKQYEAMRKTPLGLSKGGRQGGGLAAYATERIRMYVQKKYGEDALYRGGLRIYTGLDPELQSLAESALRRKLEEYSNKRGYGGPTKRPKAHPEYKGTRFKEGSRYWATVKAVTRRSVTAAMGSAQVVLDERSWRWVRGFYPRRRLHPGERILLRAQRGSPEPFFLLDQEPIAQGALLAMDPHSGEVLALVGGYDFSSSMFNRAIQAKRQTGSAVKPLVYAAALMNGRTLADQVVDSPTLFLTGREVAENLCEEGYLPKDFDPEYFGLTTYRTALEHSVNIDAVHVLNQVGYSKVIALAKAMHISTDLQPFPSMALGAFGISLWELTGAYTAFDNGGLWTEPRIILRITDKKNRTLEVSPPSTTRVMDSSAAFLVTQALTSVIKTGTASSARTMKGHFAGKTGTTDDYTDSWFIGYNPSVLCGVWVGRDDHTSLGNLMTGSRLALPIWRTFMETATKGQEDLGWTKPEGVTQVLIDPDTGLRAGIDSPCTKVVSEFFIAGSEPTTFCTTKDHFRLKLPFFLQTYSITAGRALVMPEADIHAWSVLYPGVLARVAPDRLLVSWGGTTFPVQVEVAPPREGPVPQAVMPDLPHEGDVACGARTEYVNEKR